MPSDAENLIDLTASEAVEAMQRGDLKSEDYAAALIARAKAQSALNAFIAFEPDRVLEQARAADVARHAGEAMGLLHGLPIAVKDSVNTQAYATTNGTQALRAFKPPLDAPMLGLLRAAGAIVMGKTNMTELSFGWTNNNATFGAVHNPYGHDRIPGGSSGGSCASVAARIAPLAIAADTLGSIRVPAAMCGIAGLRPTFDRYPRQGIFALTTDKLDQAGPVARAVDDLALFDRVASGHAAPVAPTSLRGVRIGVPAFYNEGVDDEIDRLTKAGFDRLAEAGAVLVRADVSEAVKSAFDVAAAIMLYETLPCITAFLRDQNTGVTFEQLLAQVPQGMQDFLKSVAIEPNRPPREAYEAMLSQREKLKAALAEHFAEQAIAVMAFPSIGAFPAKIGEEAEAEVDGEKVSFFAAYGRNTALSPAAGCPALVLPSGLGRLGLPASIEFVAPAGKDRELLSIGLSLESALGPIASPPNGKI